MRTNLHYAHSTLSGLLSACGHNAQGTTLIEHGVNNKSALTCITRTVRCQAHFQCGHNEQDVNIAGTAVH